LLEEHPKESSFHPEHNRDLDFHSKNFCGQTHATEPWLLHNLIEINGEQRNKIAELLAIPY
jgi:hypothetical protein